MQYFGEKENIIAYTQAQGQIQQQQLWISIPISLFINLKENLALHKKDTKV